MVGRGVARGNIQPHEITPAQGQRGASGRYSLSGGRCVVRWRGGIKFLRHRQQRFQQVVGVDP